MCDTSDSIPCECEIAPPEWDGHSVAGSERSDLSKIASSASISSIASFPEYDLKSDVTVVELKNKLSELLKTKGPDIIQACKNYDRRNTNKIPKSQLRQIIRMFCLPISAVQFDCLCEELQMDSGEKINYHNFFSQLSGTKMPKTTKSFQKIPNNLPIDEVELIMKEKIKGNLRNVIRAFWLFDINKDGLIQKTELRRIIRNYCFDLSDEMFNDLWKLYDPTASGIISYKDFLIKMGISAERYKKHMTPATVASSLCWKENKKDESFDRSGEQKSKRAALENRDDPAIQGLPLEEIIMVLSDRLQRRHKLLKNTFKLFDSEKNGKIALSDFRGIINFFVVAMSSSLFNKVMKKLNIDVSEDGLNYETFLENFCSSKDQEPSERNVENLEVVCAPIVQRIKNRVLNPASRLQSVFTKINTNKEWQITRPELKKAIELGLDFKLTDDEFKELTILLDPGSTNMINCLDFINLLEDSCDGKSIRKEDFVSEKEIDVDKYSSLTGKKLMSKLKHYLNKNIHNIEKAILVCDPDQSGFISAERLRAVLSGFCFPMSEDQFEETLSSLRKYDGAINYHEYLTAFKKKPDEDTKKWIATVDKLVDFKSKCPPEMPVSEVGEMLKDSVRFRKTAMLKDFKALDVCNVGVACRDDMRNILCKFAFRMTDKQFEALWETFPRNKYDQLLYDAFLERHSSDPQKPPSSEAGEERDKGLHDDRAGAEQKKDRKVSIREPPEEGVRRRVVKENRKTAKEIFLDAAPDLKGAFERVEPSVVRNFRALRFHLRREDPRSTDTVDFVTLKRVLSKFGVRFTQEEEFHLLEHFDPRLTGRINYRDFLRVFVWYA